MVLQSLLSLWVACATPDAAAPAPHAITDAGPQPTAADTRAAQDASRTAHAGELEPAHEGDAGPPADELCDGSEQIRLTFVHLDAIAVITRQTFFYPYGLRFLAIDGRCRYYVHAYLTQDHRRGYVTGTLSHADGEQLGRDLRFTQLRSWPGQHSGGSATRQIGCSDTPIPILTTQVSHMRCSCTCPDGAPSGVGDLAVGAALASVERLFAAGTPLSGPVSAMALPASSADVHVATPWPLARALASIPDLLMKDASDPRYANGPYAQLEDPAELAQLRALRDAAHAEPDVSERWLPVHVSEGGVAYEVSIRDEWPRQLRDRLAAFHPQFAELPVR